MKFSNNKFGVELHIHIDGSIRPSTICDLIKSRSIVTDKKDLESVKSFLCAKGSTSLAQFLEPFSLITECLKDSEEAIARLSEEFIEDCVNKSNLCYVETRLCPFLYTERALTPEKVVCTFLESLDRASKKHQIECRVILANLRCWPKYADEILQLAMKYKQHGVVGIDVAGDDAFYKDNSEDSSTHYTPKAIISSFKEATRNGIHRTVHAGENSPASAVFEAIEEMSAERIGHGYSGILDDAVYQQILRNSKSDVHFEICPMSSRLTGSFIEEWDRHPIHRIIKDNMAGLPVSYSINTDDPTITGQWGLEEAAFCITEMGLTPAQLMRGHFNAALASFLDKEEDRLELLHHLAKGVGIRKFS